MGLLPHPVAAATGRIFGALPPLDQLHKVKQRGAEEVSELSAESAGILESPQPFVAINLCALDSVRAGRQMAQRLMAAASLEKAPNLSDLSPAPALQCRNLSFVSALGATRLGEDD